MTAHAREIWQRIETLHAVTYFSPESIEAAKEAGLRGFWMGYFGFRSAPLGAVSAGVVDAAFANFESSMVNRAIPDAWAYAAPTALVQVRAAAAAEALRARAPSVDEAAEVANDLLAAVVAAADPIGRPLFSANRRVGRFVDPVEQLWQHCTTLREHRGDGHVATLIGAGVDGCEAHLLFVADRGVDPAVHFDHRGWSPEQQSAAGARLIERGLLAEGASELTAAGRALRADIEATTDELAGEPYERALTAADLGRLLSALTPPAMEIARSGLLPYPNPMGLPQLDDRSPDA